MSSEAEQVIQLQEKIRIRLVELGFPKNERSGNITHHLAEIAVMGRVLVEESIPLFLTLSLDHKDALGEVIVSIKAGLDEIQDAITDMGPDLVDLMNHLNADQ